VARVKRHEGGFLLESAADADGARAAGEAMQRRGWPILELRREAPDLEDIFLQLVGDGGRHA
jgi:hypothetical protein